jgi:pimeloyl-ACP methyl ester carboxylesterase
MTTYPPFLPIQIHQLTTSACLNLVKKIQRIAVTVPFCAEPIDTAYVSIGEGKPLLLLHGFDSCLLEFSQLIPFLSQDYEVYALDLLGFGLTERKLGLTYHPLTIRTHLYHFWQTVIKRPMVLVGASMGGGTAIDFAVTYPELVEKLILMDSIGFSGEVSFGQTKA